MKKAIRNIFLSVGLGTLIFVPMLIIDNGLNDTLISVLIWCSASVLYGFSFLLFKIKIKFKYVLPIHIALCLLITLTVRCLYSYFINGNIEWLKILITIPIFGVIYVALYFFIKYVGDLK